MGDKENCKIFVHKMSCRIYIFLLMLTVTCGKEHVNHYNRLPNAIAVVGRPFKYSLPYQNGNQGEYEVTVQASFVQYIKYSIMCNLRIKICRAKKRENSCPVVYNK